MRNAFIHSVGMYVPKNVIPNTYFNELLGEDVDTWLKTNVQIEERRWTLGDESTADMAEKSALEALQKANLTAQDIDLIIVSTDTPEFVSPSTASILQHRLQANKAGTFDINSACSGFVTALDMAVKYIKSDTQYQHILVIGAYNMSKYLNLHDKKTVTLFADGAGAAVISATTEKEQLGFITSKLETRGEFNEWMGIYAGAARKPITANVLENKEHLLQFVKKFPKELNPETWTRLTLELCERANIKVTDIKRFFITQININAIYETLDNLGVAHDKAETVMHQYGYTGSACIPMALYESINKGLLQRGDKILFIGSGGGLSFAAALFNY
ncbi:MAG: 3-oxoacyl-ACP synthase III family protein [Luteibaculaceae bacterium]